MNGWQEILFQDVLGNRCFGKFMVPFTTPSLPGPEAAKQPHTIKLPPLYFRVVFPV